MQKPLQGIVKSIDDAFAVIQVGTQRVEWPITKLPSVKIGDPVYLLALSSDDMEEERSAIAKTLLNDVLTGHGSPANK